MHPSARSSHELEHLADTLWHDRHVVEFLLFKLVSAKLVLAADERRFVATALDEVEPVLGLLREAEATREQAVAAVARLWDQPLDEITLAELAIRSPEPLRTVFRDHQRAFGRMASEIEKTAAANRLLAGAAISHVHRTLDALTGPTVGGTYTADGHHDVALTGPVRLDDAQRVMGTTLARVGANNRVESSLARTQDARLSLRGELAEVEDPDIAEAILELQTQEVAYTATLRALGRALPPSLAAFLR